MMATIDRSNLGFLLAKATQRWNERLHARFREAGFGEVRPSYGAILVPLYEEDGLRLGELGERAMLSKQTMTTMVRLMEREGLVVRRPDPEDGRASRVFLTEKARRFHAVAEAALSDLDAFSDDVAGAEAKEEVRRWLRAFTDL